MKILHKNILKTEKIFRFLYQEIAPDKLKEQVEKINTVIVGFLEKQKKITIKDSFYYNNIADKLEAVKAEIDQNKSTYKQADGFNDFYDGLNSLISKSKQKATAPTTAEAPTQNNETKEATLEELNTLIKYFEKPKEINVEILNRLEASLEAEKSVVEKLNFKKSSDEIFDTYEDQIISFFKEKGIKMTKEDFTAEQNGPVQKFVGNYKEKLNDALKAAQKMREELLHKRYNFIDLGIGVIAPRNSLGLMIAALKPIGGTQLTVQQTIPLNDDFELVLNGSSAGGPDIENFWDTHLSSIQATIRTNLLNAKVPEGEDFNKQWKLLGELTTGVARNGNTEKDAHVGAGLTVTKNMENGGAFTSRFEAGIQVSDTETTTLSGEKSAADQYQTDYDSNPNLPNNRTYKEQVSETAKNRGLYMLIQGGYVQDFVPGKTTRINVKLGLLSQKIITINNEIKAIMFDKEENLPDGYNPDDVDVFDVAVIDPSTNQPAVRADGSVILNTQYMYRPQETITVDSNNRFSVGKVEINVEQELFDHTSLKAGVAYTDKKAVAEVMLTTTLNKRVTAQAEANINTTKRATKID